MGVAYDSNPSSHTSGAHRPCACDQHPMGTPKCVLAYECVVWLKGKVLVPEGILEGFPGEMALSLDHEGLSPFFFFFKDAQTVIPKSCLGIPHTEVGRILSQDTEAKWELITLVADSPGRQWYGHPGEAQVRGAEGPGRQQGSPVWLNCFWHGRSTEESSYTGGRKRQAVPEVSTPSHSCCWVRVGELQRIEGLPRRLLNKHSRDKQLPQVLRRFCPREQLVMSALGLRAAPAHIPPPTSPPRSHL